MGELFSFASQGALQIDRHCPLAPKCLSSTYTLTKTSPWAWRGPLISLPTPANKSLITKVLGCHYSPTGTLGTEMQMPFQHQQCLGRAELSRAGPCTSGMVCTLRQDFQVK